MNGTVARLQSADELRRMTAPARLLERARQRPGDVAFRAKRLGAVFVTLFPYPIEALVGTLAVAQRYAGPLFALNCAALGVVMILFLVFEPLGLVGIWKRVQTYFLLWPFKHRLMAG